MKHFLNLKLHTWNCELYMYHSIIMSGMHIIKYAQCTCMIVVHVKDGIVANQC